MNMQSNIQLVVFIAILATTYWLRTDRKKQVPPGQIVNNSLTTSEKVLIWVLCVLNPVIGGAILYYGWRKKLPQKARQANNISLLAFGLEFVLIVGLVFLRVVK